MLDRLIDCVGDNMYIRLIMLLSCIVSFSTAAFAQGIPQVMHGEWQVTNTAVGGITTTNTLCLPKTDTDSWMILADPGKGFSCKAIGKTVVENGGLTGIFQERCLLNQPQVGVVRMNMKFRVTIGVNERDFHSVAIGEGIEHGYTFPINTTTTGHYVGACH
ncbi:MAG: DUF3617 domain-containing protein [Acidithiobacillus ferrivorans]